MKNEKMILKDYEALLTELKVKIKTAQVKAVLAVNSELIKLYWEIGKSIAEKQKISGRGDAIVEKIAVDVRKEFPTIKGFSRSNIFSMRQFYLAYKSEGENVQQLVGQIPWGHNLLLINTLRDIRKPIGISEYKVTRELRKDYQKNLPSVQKLEKLIRE